MEKYGRLVGYFDGSLPNLWTTDTDVIKSVFVKDFGHFVNRRDFAFQTRVFRKFLTIIRDQEWKDVRSSITPAFTTGKIKRMSPMIKACADRLITKLETIATKEGKFNAKTQLSAFTMDVIARCAFGMTIENLGEENDPFMRNAKAVFSPPISQSPFILLPFVCPKVMLILGEMHFVTKEFNFFVDILQNLIKERAKSDQKYYDFVEAATEAISGYTKKVNGESEAMWNNEEVEEIIIAQSTLFLLAGFDTTASTLTNTIFYLARNQDVQEKLYAEILKKIEQFCGINDDMTLDLPYMEQVIKEVMRLHPAIPRIERECNEEINVKGFKAKKGILITVPTYALHYDEEYYPDPFKFNPDRWSPENKNKLNPYAYMPFGMGPRNCVGMRFAMQEMKVALSNILKRFRFFPVETTPEEMKLKNGFFMHAQTIDVTIGIEVRQ